MQGYVGTTPALTTQRRQLDVEDYLSILRRNLGWIMGPLLLSVVVAVVTAFFWPNTYISTAAIRVVPPQVPERFVPTNVNVQMAERLGAMRDTILSRNALTNIIQTHDLYRKERSRVPMEDIIEDMRKDIEITMPRAVTATARGLTAFQISFRYENRYTAQKVTRDLMTRFIDENIRERSGQSQMTTQFLREQYEQAKAELDAITARLTQFRINHVGRLPDQMNTNLQQVAALETRILSLNSAASRASQDKMLMESDLRSLREKLNAYTSMAAANGGNTGGGRAAREQVDEQLLALDREIKQLERGIERLLEQYRPGYPTVQAHQARLATVKKEREEYLNKKLTIQSPSSPATEGSDPPVRATFRSPEVLELQTQIERAQAAIRAKEIEAERYIREIADADRRLKEVHSRIETGPIGAGQLDQLMRDYQLAKTRYETLNANVSQSEMSTEIEQRKQGETLEVLDLPSLPETPSDPDRYMIIGMGAAIGLMIGAAMVVIRELKDQSLKTLKDVRAYTQFNVLGSVPLLENDLVVRRRRRIAWLAWSTACLLSVFVMSGSIYYYMSTQM